MIAVFLSVFAVAFIGLPQTAHAWGTGAHVDFGLTLLGNLALLTPAVRALLKRFPQDFLYGNIAADTVIGKNLAPEEEHVHNWDVAIRLFDHSEDDAGKAFVFGYLSHLAADTVAHNYFVPKKRVDGFRSITAGHAYWELRYDSFLPAHVWEASGKLAKVRASAFERHDRLLEQGLKATLFTVASNRAVYSGFVTLANRVERWRDLMRSHAERSATPFDSAERDQFRSLAVGAITDFLNDFRESRTYAADATGQTNLGNCWRIAALLRKGAVTGRMASGEADDIARKVGLALREGLHVRREVDLSEALAAAEDVAARRVRA